ncbi:hypothetical protein MACH24_30320 [Erythrobacter sp. Dej080120_24]|nr:hypothetical protein MACH24_30320 [Erythrobacter sp. Dej080120_24]
MTTKTALPVQQRTLNRVRSRDYILPACVALACAGAAFAGADTTFDPALTKFTTSSKARVARSSPYSASRAV